MIKLPENIQNAASLEDAAQQLGLVLNMEGPTPLNATKRALEDPTYARALLAARKMAVVRDQLLFAPETVSIKGTPQDSQPQTPPPKTSKVVTKAVGAALKWGMDGLKHAEPWVIERRLANCADCEFKADAPETLVYRSVKVLAGKDAKICTQCNCLINTKAALSTEHCPEKDPANPELSRWQEPWVDLEGSSKWPW